MKPHFAMMAQYNAWANARLYAEARAVSNESYRKDVGAFFRSLHGTLNHLLVTRSDLDAQIHRYGRSSI
jgi:uncharacterized damage-inducible protein DinB